MAAFETWLENDLKKPLQVQYLKGNMFSADNQGNKVGVKVYDNGTAASLSGSVSGNIIRADGSTVTVAGTLSGNTAYILMPQAAYAVPGIASIIIKLTSGSVVTTLGACVVTIYESTTSTAVDPGTIIPSVQTLINQINNAVASIPADYSSLWTSLAPAYSTDASYVAGQYTTYNSGLWRFNTAHSGSWNASHVTAVNIGGELSDLKSAFDSVCVETENIDFTTAGTRNGAINSSNQWSTSSGMASYTFTVNNRYNKLSVIASANATAHIGLLKNSTLSHGQTPPFCTGVNSRIVINPGETQSISIPTDCTYIVITKTTTDSVNHTPANVQFEILKSIPSVDSSLTVSGSAADAKVVGDKFEIIDSELLWNNQVNFSNETVYNYIISSSTNVWSGSGERYCYIIETPENAKTISITAMQSQNARYAFLKSNSPVAQTTPDYCTGVTAPSTVQANTSETLAIPNDCKYVYIYKSYNGTDGTPTAVAFSGIYNIGGINEQVAENTTKLEGITAIPSQIFNIDLATTDGEILTGFDDDYQSANGYTPPTGWENRITINKYVVCDDIKYRANISLGTAGAGVCVLGTETLAGSAADHATLVKFDFGNALVSFLTGSDAEGGSNIDGKSIPNYTYSSFALTNLSGTEYRIEIGRTKRAPYAKVYNLTTGALCGEKSLMDVYETSSSYGGKAGAMYDLPNFGVISGTVTFNRVSASVPNGVFAAFIGDSITEGSKCAWADVWANKSILYLGSGVNCGRGSGVIKHMIRCATDILPAVKPKYVFVTIGTNGTPTLTQFNNLIALIKNIGAIPVINHIAMNSKTGDGSTSEVNAIVEQLGTDSARFDVATAVNNDPLQGQNTSLFNSDGLHPNAAGGLAMYNQFIADLGWIKPDEWET